MLLNYIKIALRHFRKYKIITVINISGLAIGIASFILIIACINFINLTTAQAFLHP